MGPRANRARGPAERSPPDKSSRATGAARGSGAGIMGPRERTAPGGPAGRSPPVLRFQPRHRRDPRERSGGSRGPRERTAPGGPAAKSPVLRFQPRHKARPAGAERGSWGPRERTAPGSGDKSPGPRFQPRHRRGPRERSGDHGAPASEPRQGVRRDEVPGPEVSAAPQARPAGAERGITGPRERTAPGGPAGRSPPVLRFQPRHRRGPRERSGDHGAPASEPRQGVRRGRSPPVDFREERAVSELKLIERVLGGQDGCPLKTEPDDATGVGSARLAPREDSEILKSSSVRRVHQVRQVRRVPGTL